MQHRNVLTSLLFLLATLSVVSALRTFTVNVGNVGTVKTIGLGVYWDSACTNKTSAIQWGTLYPNMTVSETLYIKNLGSVAAQLNFNCSNWNPSNCPAYISLAWNYNGGLLSSNQADQVILSLTVSANCTGITSFSFTITFWTSG
jgi:hypothetical protein